MRAEPKPKGSRNKFRWLFLINVTISQKIITVRRSRCFASPYGFDFGRDSLRSLLPPLRMTLLSGVGGYRLMRAVKPNLFIRMDCSICLRIAFSWLGLCQDRASPPTAATVYALILPNNRPQKTFAVCFHADAVNRANGSTCSTAGT